MNFKNFFLFTIALCCLFAGCSTKKSNSEKPDGAITISPFPPEQGKELVVTYNRAHPKALYGSIKELWLQIIINTKRIGEMRYAKLLPESKDSRLCSTTFRVPDDAEWIQLFVAPPGIIVSEEHFSGPVCKGCEAARGSLKHAIL